MLFFKRFGQQTNWDNRDYREYSYQRSRQRQRLRRRLTLFTTLLIALLLAVGLSSVSARVLTQKLQASAQQLWDVEGRPANEAATLRL